MRKLLLLFLLWSSIAVSSYAQTWAGGATGAWDNAANWSPIGIPGAGALVSFTTDAVVTGTATNHPAQIRVASGATVTLDLNITIGDGVIAEHAILIAGTGSTLHLGVAGNNRAIDIFPPTSHNGINIPGTTTNGSVNIASSTEVNIEQALNGININSSNSVVNNNGLLNIDSSTDGILIGSGTVINNADLNIVLATGDGIDNSGVFTNNGTLSVLDANSNGINNKAGGSFTNTASILISDLNTLTDGISNAGTFLNGQLGDITIANTTDDGIEITGSSTFTNEGILNISGSSSGGSGNHAILVSDGTFLNSSTGTLTASSASGARTVLVAPSGTFTNAGSAALAGGTAAQLLRVEGTATNTANALLDLGSGNVNLANATASFTNTGLLLTNATGTPVIVTTAGATATNNGYYDANNGTATNFASTVLAAPGIDLNAVQDAGGACSISMGQQTLVWAGPNGFSGTATGGTLNFGAGVFADDPVTLTTTYAGVALSTVVDNICAAALPITLIDFTATPMPKSIQLKWQTATERNNHFMAVERSNNGRNFSEIGRVAGQGNSTSTQHYELEDVQPINGINYYRLRQVDIDGTVTLSKLIAVFFTQEDAVDKPRIFPNLVRTGGTITLDLSAISVPGRQTLVLKNFAGQVMRTYTVVNNTQQDIGLADLPSGTYLFYLSDFNDSPLRLTVLQ